MNDKVYANYLMHGRTKGSRNGISTTKGYTAVGQKAKGKLVNGTYVYEGPRDGYQYVNGTYVKDDPAATYDVPREKRVEGLSKGKYWYETPELPNGVAAYPKLTTTWNKAYADANHVDSYPNGGWDAEMLRKRKKWLAEKAQKEGAARGDAQQAALAQLRKQNQNNVAAKKKAQALKDVAAKGSQNDWQQQANAKRDDVETYRKYKNNAISGIASKSKNGDVDVMYHPEPGYTSVKTIKKGAMSKGAANNWQEMGNQRRAANEAFVKAGTGKSKVADINGMDQKAREEATTRYINEAVATTNKYNKMQSDLYGAGDAKTRNSRSDVQNAYEDAKLEAKNAFQAAKAKVGAKLYTKMWAAGNKDKKKKKK